MSLPDRLSSSNSKEDTSMPARRDKKEEGEPPDGDAPLIQRCVIIQKDERGYGFTVSGDNPVFVASVKSEGAASRSGVQQGDKILKVNGTLVTNRNHLDVVKLIKSGSYVALTLLGKPNSVNSSLNSTPSFNFPAVSVTRITAPLPVNADKDRELVQQKVHMTKAMHETACEDYQKLLRLYSKNPSEKLQAQLQEKERTVKALENQLDSLRPDGEDGGPMISALPRLNRNSDSEHGSLDSFSVQSWQAQRRDSGPDIRHAKQSSVPSLVYQGQRAAEARGSGAAVARSKSDATARKSKATSTFYVPRQASASNASEASSLPTTTTTTSDLGSMSDSPHTSPSISPTPSDAHIRHNGQDEDSSHSMGTADIITIDDEDVGIGSTPLSDVKSFTAGSSHPSSQFIAKITGPEQANDPGPFVDIRHLESTPAYMAVLLQYLISNSDPSSVLFHIISDAYSRSSASTKELRKWAYEIYSTFVVRSSPLSIGADDNLVSQIDNILTISANKVDNEMALKNLFFSTRQAVQGEIASLLADFRSKKDLGMGNFYGFQKIPENMDRQGEIRAAEDILIPHLEKVGHDDGSSRAIPDRELAISWAVATVLRLNGSSKSHHNAILDRIQTFMMKDKRIKFTVTRSGRAKSVKNHQFNPQHFYNSTACHHCTLNIWGVGYQGYQCQNCEMVLHKHCTDEITDVCGGKLKKRASRLIPSMLPTRKPSTTSQSGTEVSGVRPHSEIHSPSFIDSSGFGPTVQPLPKDEDSELAGIPTGHSVKHIVNRYQEMTSPTGPGPGLGVPGGMPSFPGEDERRGSTDLNRSGSLNNKGEKGDRPARRAKSDVDVDSEAFRAINQSGSSSASSMSNRSGESPSNSSDNVNEMLLHEDPDVDLEPELPPLKQVLGDDLYRKLKPKEKKRQDVLNELIYTERAHLRNLKIMDGLFNKPMLTEKGNVNDLAKALFPNMEQMIALHESLTKDLREKQKANPAVKDVGDILLKRFDGEAGDVFRKGCAEYCRNQSFAIDALKKTMRKDPKLSQFLSDAETNPMCRRLHLKDLVPSQVHRLTKYPLLIDNLLKYTPANSEEHKRLERALERSKHILAYVNQAVKECQNYHKLKEIQKRLDKRSIEMNDPAMNEIKYLDLTKGHKLIFDSPLTMKLKANRTIDLHVLLFDDLLVMLQKQDDKYLLRYQNSNTHRDSSVKDERYTHSPVLYVRNILARHVATDKKSFFVVNMSESRAQMYEFIAATSDLRIKWCDMINEQMESAKKAGKDDIGLIRAPPSFDDIHQGHITAQGSSNMSDDEDDDNMDQVDHGQVIDRISDSGLIQPEEIRVRSIVSAQATPVRTIEERLRHNADVISSALEERHCLMMQVLDLPYTPPATPRSPSSSTTTAAAAADVAAQREEEEEEEYEEGEEEEEDEMGRMLMMRSADDDDPAMTLRAAGDGADVTSPDVGRRPDGNNNLELTLLRDLLRINTNFIRKLVAASKQTALQQHHQHLQHQQHQNQQQQQQHQQQQQQQQRQHESKRPLSEVHSEDSNSTSPAISPSRRMSTGPDDTGNEGDSGGSSSVSSTQSRVPSSPPSQLPPEQADKPQAYVSMPMDQLKGMSQEMNSILAKLMSTMNTGGKERQKWREEIQEAQRKLNALKEQQRQMTLSGAVPPDRDPESYDEMETSQTSLSSISKPPLSSPLSSPTTSIAPPRPLSDQDLVVVEETVLVSQPPVEEAVHHGVQEAIMDESVETLAIRPSVEMATMVGQGRDGGDGVRMIEVSMGGGGEEDDEEDDAANEVSVQDLPLPDVGAIHATAGIEPQPLPSPQLLDAVDLDESSDDDDNDTLVSKGEHPDLASLSSMSIDGGSSSSYPADSTGADRTAATGPQDRRDSVDGSSASDSRGEEEEGTSVDGDDDSKDYECTPIEI